MYQKSRDTVPVVDHHDSLFVIYLQTIQGDKERQKPSYTVEENIRKHGWSRKNNTCWCVFLNLFSFP